MKLAILIIAILGFFIALKGKKNISNPFVAFNFLWIIVAIFIYIGNVYVFEPNSVALKCVLVGVIGFNLAQFMPKVTIGELKFGICEREQYAINYRLVYVLSFIVLIFSVVSAAGAISEVLSGANFSAIRSDYHTYTSSESVYMYYFRSYVISPLRYVVIISTIIGILKREKIGKTLVINTIFIIILQAITSGGRYILMNTIFMIVCGISLFTDRERITRKQKLGLLIIVVLFSYIIVFLTNDRATYLTKNMTVGERLYETIFTYFAGSVTYLGEVIETTPTIVGSTFGVNFFAGFIIPIFVILNFMHLIPYPAVFNVIGTYACAVLKIGPSTYYNAMPTIFGYFYIDGGVILVLIESLLFGYICKRLYIRSGTGNILMSALYILIFMQICNSSTRWFFYSPDYCLAFLYLNIVIKKSLVVGGGIAFIIICVLDRVRTTVKRIRVYCFYAFTCIEKWEVIA